MRDRLSWFCLALLASLIPAEAAAQGIPARAVRTMRARSGVHPMAAPDGRVGMTARVPAGIDPRSWGLVPVAPGIGAVRLLPSELAHFEQLHPEPRLTWWPPLHLLLDKAVPISGVARVPAGNGPEGRRRCHRRRRHRPRRDPRGPAHRDRQDARGMAHRHVTTAQRTSQGARGRVRLQRRDQLLRGARRSRHRRGRLERSPSNDAPRDEVGHGTHVASIAAGNGLGSNKGTVYAGVAPEAVLIGARVTRAGGDISDTDVLLATKFVFDRAEALGLPAVVEHEPGSRLRPS